MLYSLLSAFVPRIHSVSILTTTMWPALYQVLRNPEIITCFPPHSLEGKQIIFIYLLVNIFIILRYNSLKIHPYKVYNSVFFDIVSCANITTNSQTFLSSQKRNPMSISGHSPFPPPFQPLSVFLSQKICLFWAFHPNVIMHVAFCAWILSLSITFSRFFHGVSACFSSPFLFMSN